MQNNEEEISEDAARESGSNRIGDKAYSEFMNKQDLSEEGQTFFNGHGQNFAFLLIADNHEGLLDYVQIADDHSF